MPGGWMLRKLDSLAGAVVAAAGGVAASQWREFLQQYLQRLGGHVDEARLNRDHLTSLYEVAGAAEKPVVADMLADGEARVAALMEALRQLTDAGAVMQPVVFVRTLDPMIAQATLERFQPAVPLDTASLLWAGAGMVLALMLYELVKATLWVVARGPMVLLGLGAGRDGGPKRRTRSAPRRAAPPERVEPKL
ncbi:DUF2937 family protein [Roseospira navarrensis]|nr:DUF2937 family protein [Roseospira navarrensis]